jgi:hypothetical protein
MPEEYWAQEKTLAESVQSVEISETDLANSLLHIFYLAQRCVILDNVGDFLQSMKGVIGRLV